ncbi:MAG: DUF3592 domain-containing protein [Oscillospiraceae bacterium]
MRQSDRIARLVFSVLGLLLLGIGGNLIIDFARLSVRMSSSRQVNATVVEVIRVREHNGHDTLYTPVYEYEDGGEVKRYTSDVSRSRRAEIGSETTLYISKDGKIYQKSGAAVTLFVGIIFAVVGGVFTFITFKLWKKKPEETEEQYL